MRAPASLTVVSAIARDLAVCLEFFSRLPVPGAVFAGFERPPLASASRVLPLAGLVIGGCGAIGLFLCRGLGLPALLSAAIGIGCLIAASGGLHEDGLADTADGLGGGATRDRKLAIMRDSRIGTYGVLAVGLALILRVVSLAALLERSGLAGAVAALLASAAVSRPLALLPILILPPARPDGLARSVGLLAQGAARTCYTLAALIGIGLPTWAGLGLAHSLLSCALAVAGAVGVVGLAWRQLGGHTGDIAGASQQAGEIGFLVGLLAFPLV